MALRKVLSAAALVSRTPLSLLLILFINLRHIYGPICMKILPIDQNLMLNIMYFMVQPYNMHEEARNGKKRHFYAPCARIRALCARDQKSDNASTSALVFCPLTPNFVQIAPFLVAILLKKPERRLSAYARRAGSAKSLSVGPLGPNKEN